jgi:protoheme IX farnesyltransferase
LKSQSALLLTTGFCAYTLTRGLPLDHLEAVWMAGGLLLSISGCTALNMHLDRDIDARMTRTADRPLPAGRIRPLEAAIFGVVLSVAGLALSFGLAPWFGAVVSLDFVFDLLVYTAWLKRRTPLSIVFGANLLNTLVLAACAFLLRLRPVALDALLGKVFICVI